MTVRLPGWAVVVRLAFGLRVGFFLVVERFARRAMENSPDGETCRPLKDDSRCRGRGLQTEPEAHEDLVHELAADSDVPAADSFLDETERLVEASRATIRGEDRQLRLRKTPHAHPFQDAFHHPAAEARFAPTVLDCDPDAPHMAVLSEGPGVAVGRPDDFVVGQRDEEHVSYTVEGREPTQFLLEVGYALDHNVDLFAPDAVRVPHRELGVLRSTGS